MQNIIKKFKEHYTIETVPKSGSLKINSEGSVRLLIRDAKANPNKTALKLLKNWKSSLPISINTVKQIFQKYNLFGCITEKKTVLNERHIHNRF